MLLFTMSADELNEGRGILLSIKKKLLHQVEYRFLSIHSEHILNNWKISTVKIIRFAYGKWSIIVAKFHNAK